MRRIALGLLLALVATPSAADEVPEPGPKKTLSKGWQVPAGQEARFAEAERECLGHAMAPRGRRADPRKFASCMEGRGWRRK